MSETSAADTSPDAALEAWENSRLKSLSSMGEAGQADAALRVLAARGEKDGAARGAVLICNPTGTSLPLELSANGSLTSCSVLTEEGLAEIPLPAELESGAVLLAEYAL